MNRPRSLALPLLVLLLAALALGACGSSDDSSDKGPGGSSDKPASGSPDTPGGSTGELSKAQLIAQADTICRAASNKIKALATPKSRSEVQAYTKDAAAATADGVGKLEGLSPPAAIKPDYEAFLDIARNLTKQAAKAADATSSRDAAKLAATLQDVIKQGATTRRLAQKIGFKDCGTSAVGGATGGTPAPAAPAAP